MQALYRKYRPTKLEDVVGQDQVTTPLKNAIKQGKISHAYLFTGPRGCGKTSVARIFAHEINHFPYQIEDNYVDIIEIDAASNTGVDNIRELREKAVIAPVKGKYKVYIIDEVHMLTKSAFNALLKTLEEPPKSVIFIMATTDAHKVPVTISSRSQVYNFQLATPEIIQKHLEKIAKAEKIAIEPAALEVLVKKGGGSFRDSISLLDQISTLTGATPEAATNSKPTEEANSKSAAPEKISKSAVLAALGLPTENVIETLLDAYKQGDIAKITEALKSELNTGSKPEILAENLIQAIIKNPEPKLLPLLEKLPEVKNPFPEAKILLAFLAEAAEKPVLRLSTTPKQSPNTPSTQPLSTASKTAPKTSSEPQEAPLTPEPSSIDPFDVATYLANVKAKSSALVKILEKSQLQKQGNTLFIAPEHKTHGIILKSANNQKILHEFLPENTTIEISDTIQTFPETTQTNANSAQTPSPFTKISDIMGTVTEVNTEDGDPFKE